MDIERDGNFIEAGVWLIAAVTVIWQAGRDRIELRRTLWVLGVTLAVFGLSDVIEARTGAWWRPWWLFIWKAACVVPIAGAFVNYFRIRRAMRGKEEQNQ
jgi:hypothetical protein